MKKITLFVMLVFALWSCTSQKESTSTQAPVASVVEDSSGYDIMIMDPEFDRWYAMRFSSAMDRSNEYYSSMNSLAVRNWNEYFTRGRFARIINSYINYNSATEYGVDVNRQLYWYFKYIEENFRIRLLR